MAFVCIHHNKTVVFFNLLVYVIRRRGTIFFLRKLKNVLETEKATKIYSARGKSFLNESFINLRNI